ncbi:MAG: AtpZ/AtpI family protein [Acidobacteriaceae bacterium]
MPQSNNHGKKPDGALAALAKYSHLGFILPAAALVGWLVGLGLDRLFHTHWIAYAGLAFGVFAGFYDLIRSAIRLGNEKDE